MATRRLISKVRQDLNKPPLAPRNLRTTMHLHLRRQPLVAHPLLDLLHSRDPHLQRVEEVVWYPNQSS